MFYMRVCLCSCIPIDSGESYIHACSRDRERPGITFITPSQEDAASYLLNLCALIPGVEVHFLWGGSDT